MKGLWEHFRKHGAIHALWMISILILIIAALMIRTPGGNVIAEYIAFATSVASLVLAVVAIFHSLVANQSFSETIGSLRLSAENVQTAARNIADVSATLSDQSERMIGEVSRLPPAFQALSDKMDEKFSQSTTEPTLPLAEGGESTITYFEGTVYGGKLALYIVSLAALRKKEFSLFEIFSKNAIWANMINGYVHAMRTLRPCKLHLDFKSNDGKYRFTVVSAGDLSINEIVTAFSEMDRDYTKDERILVDAYFFGNDESEQVEIAATEEGTAESP